MLDLQRQKPIIMFFLQDSLHISQLAAQERAAAAKKKGIKSSLGRIFGKKEKVGWDVQPN